MTTYPLISSYTHNGDGTLQTYLAHQKEDLALERERERERDRDREREAGTTAPNVAAYGVSRLSLFNYHT